MILILDNFDSFTYNLVDYFMQLNVRCQVIRNNVDVSEISQYEYQRVVLSPGPQTPEKSGSLNDILSYYEKKLPILGICLGHQAIGQRYGGQLVKARIPMHGKLSKITLESDPIFEGIGSSCEVVRYHSLVIEINGSELIPLAYSEEKELMAVRHQYLPIWGLQYHPEAALTEYGLLVLKNWLQINCIDT